MKNIISYADVAVLSFSQKKLLSFVMFIWEDSFWQVNHR